MTRTAARILVDQLKVQGVNHVFCVPGESYLAVLDAFYDKRGIRLIVNRHESGSTFMADAYAKLTGSTQDRRTPVQQFQAGTLPIFLISLKAGGSGLNLTAADTVIHFDPWWNPAAEAQASDRAYRIGQDKPVFVYKLIARGSVEEKIQHLQQAKANLARGVLQGGSQSQLQLSEDDLQALFAPLSD
jgi:SNF2 family DNA or RNA helicase